MESTQQMRWRPEVRRHADNAVRKFLAVHEGRMTLRDARALIAQSAAELTELVMTEALNIYLKGTGENKGWEVIVRELEALRDQWAGESNG